MYFSTLLIAAELLAAAMPDTLETVTVVADRGVIVSRTDTVSITKTSDIGSILGLFPSLYIGDNGGAAGLKTVSLRGLGSAHTAIYVDGVRTGNVQSGQTDLTNLGMEGFSSAVVDYAQNSLSFHTSRPEFKGRKTAGDIRFKGSSFSTFQPYARVGFRLADNISAAACLSGISSKGNFPYGDGQTRNNNDIKQLRGGLDFWGITDGGDWHAKAGANYTGRGTPGSAAWPSQDRQEDRNAFIQGLFKRNFTPLYSLSASARASYDDLAYKSSWGDSRYGQTELQLNTAHRFRVNDFLTISLAADLQWNGLKSTEYDASRLTATTALASALRLGRLRADLAMEYQLAADAGEENRSCLSPSAQLRFNVADGLDLVAFGKRAYRTPTFNELYYKGYGNPELKPEDAWLTDIGAQWSRDAGRICTLSAKADIFYYLLNDKIISAPTAEDPNIWLPYNIGKVEMKGADLQTGAELHPDGWTAEFKARYSFQDAVDRTEGSSYGSQIPYIARNTVVLNAGLHRKGWTFGILWSIHGGRRDAHGPLDDWESLDINAGRDFTLTNGMSLGIEAAARNLTDCRYELVSDYPMPGRSFVLSMNFKF